ncbi:MAG TPA: sialidase family protein, partial [Longimicrobiales bacterium]|nr:sialidase family protein [Longimicrobiales bacterium]
MSRLRVLKPAAPASLPFVLALASGACAGDQPRDDGGATAGAPPVALEALVSPAPVGSAEPNVTAGPDGFYLSWLEPTGPGRHALRFSRLGPDGWTGPGTVMEREDLFVNWADFPSMLVLEDGTMAAHWLEKSGAGTYAYDVRAAVSTDGGETWSEDIIPHSDRQEAEHGFVSLFPMGGDVGAVWLDGRETVKGDPMTLRFTTISDDGAAPDVQLDGNVCDCCQTDAAVTSAGPIVVYRGRTEEEVRDILAVRRVDGGWTEPRRVHDDGWVINACPVNGPAVAAAGERVAVVWFTASPEPRVLLAFSDDAGATFAPPVRLDEGGAQGRVDVALLEDGSALAVWLEAGDSGAELRVRRVTGDSAGRAMRLTGTSSERASGFPRMARRGNVVLFTWTESGDPSRVRTVLG